MLYYCSCNGIIRRVYVNKMNKIIMLDHDKRFETGAYYVFLRKKKKKIINNIICPGDKIYTNAIII